MFEKLIKKKPVNEETEYLFLVNHHEKNDLYRSIYNLFGADIACLSDSFSFKSNRF